MSGYYGNIPPEIQSESGVSAYRVKRIRRKDRVRPLGEDSEWEEVLKENLETVNVDAPAAVRNEPAPPVSQTEREEPPPVRRSVGEQPEPEELMRQIRTLADDPEKLLESHLGIFTAPVSNGKLLNSKG